MLPKAYRILAFAALLLIGQSTRERWLRLVSFGGAILIALALEACGGEQQTSPIIPSSLSSAAGSSQQSTDLASGGATWTNTSSVRAAHESGGSDATSTATGGAPTTNTTAFEIGASGSRTFVDSSRVALPTGGSSTNLPSPIGGISATGGLGVGGASQTDPTTDSLPIATGGSLATSLSVSGSGGTTDTTSNFAGMAGATETAGHDSPWTVSFVGVQGSATDQTIATSVELVNDSDPSAVLTDVTVRYWVTLGSGVLVGGCSSSICNSATVAAVEAKTAHSDYYLEFRFMRGTILTSGKLAFMFDGHRDDWAKHDEGVDWSYPRSLIGGEPMLHITVYSAGKLVWGIEP